MADLTEENAEIEDMLKKLGADAAGLPVLAIFPAGNPNQPKVVTGVYSQDQLVKLIEEASRPTSEITAKTGNDSPVDPRTAAIPR